MRKNANIENPGCYKTKNGYDVIFSNPILHVKEYLVRNKTLIEAKEIYLNRQLQFYLEHPYLLPKFISIQKEKFRVVIQYKVNFDEDFRHLYLGTFDSLQAAENAKLEFITNLL